ncbi:hypothetical protein FOL47_008156 [Perkinsus chesapeaki]|uniref:ER-bound oxygenase mpaB/mpaB'/Rubber oxygenase catalytic domain-containing protein n=1 Tax=Perkinsus chesapeaki TaxID=330153 RepID=A0A7J6LFR9_PERCH|nr:hypothetical protein FOL47_008156 [Perkinsus chesapeaki]
MTRLLDLSNQDTLPQWFDEDLFRVGCTAYKKIFFTFSIGFLIALNLGVLRVPRFSSVLENTGLIGSNNAHQAYRRFKDTGRHFAAWLDPANDITCPTNMARLSLLQIRAMHLLAKRITQKGCKVGYAVSHYFLGIHDDFNPPGSTDLVNELLADFYAVLPHNYDRLHGYGLGDGTLLGYGKMALPLTTKSGMNDMEFLKWSAGGVINPTAAAIELVKDYSFTHGRVMRPLLTWITNNLISRNQITQQSIQPNLFDTALDFMPTKELSPI